MEGRLHYVDALRVAAFAILIVYHCSVAFFPDLKWLIKSTETSATLSLVMDFPRSWRLPLLFFVSGMGTWFAYRACGGRNFITERVKRLGLPLIFAMCVLVVPQVWYERMYEDGYTGSLLTFWVERYFSEGKYPTGNFTWAHVWFVGYLLTITVVLLPLMRLVAGNRLRGTMEVFEKLAATPAIYLLFLLPLLPNLALSPIFPRETNALYNDGAWFASWTCWFALGFLVARHHKAVIGSLVERRGFSLWLAAMLTVFLYRFCWIPGEASAIGSYEKTSVLYKTLQFALAWTMILALVGYGARYLNRPSAVIAWLNHKVFPLYLIHQTVVVAALYYVLPVEAALWAKVSMVIAATITGSMLFAVAADHLPWPFRILFGFAGQPPEKRGATVATRS